MGKKGVGRRPKSGTHRSLTPTSKCQLVQPNEVRADHYKFGAANKRATMRRQEEESSNYLKSDSKNNADDDSDNQPQVLKLKAVVVGDEMYF
jgi:hypothetical protein